MYKIQIAPHLLKVRALFSILPFRSVHVMREMIIGFNEASLPLVFINNLVLVNAYLKPVLFHDLMNRFVVYC